MVPAPTPLTRCSNLLLEALAIETTEAGLRELIEEASAIAFGMDEYINKCSTQLIVPRGRQADESSVVEVFDALLRATEETDWAQIHNEKKTKYLLSASMCSGKYEATVLQQFALMMRARRVLEIGMFTGTTTLALALLPQVGVVTPLDIEEYLVSFCEPYWQRAGVAEKINPKIGDATDSLRILRDQCQSFDLVFIDADKPSYRTYVEAVLDMGLLAEDGVILADNTLYKGLPFAPNPANNFDVNRNAGTNNKSRQEATDGIVSFNEWVRDNDDLVCSVLPIRDGISVIRRRP